LIKSNSKNSELAKEKSKAYLDALISEIDCSILKSEESENLDYSDGHSEGLHPVPGPLTTMFTNLLHLLLFIVFTV